MRITIALPNEPTYSETFIQAHIDRLPARIDLLYTSEVGYEPSLPSRLLKLATRKALRLSHDAYRTHLVRRHLRKVKAHVVLAEFGPTACFVLPACRREGTPLVAHFHGYDVSREDVLREYEAEYRDLFHHCAALVVVSHEMRRRLLDLGAKEEKIVVNPCGVDTHRFSPPSTPRAAHRLLAVGRFVEKKAPHLTLRAFARAQKSIPDATLTMIGEGPLLSDCRQLARELGVAHATLFTGALPHEAIARHMRQATAFVQHSRRAPDGNREGLPVTALEAQASALPVVVTRHAGIPEAIIDGETGYLVEEGDVQAMSERMFRLLREPHRARRMGEAGRRRMIEEFSMESCIDGLLKVLSRASSLGDGGSTAQHEALGARAHVEPQRRRRGGGVGKGDDELNCRP